MEHEDARQKNGKPSDIINHHQLMKTIYLSLLLLIPMQILAQTTNGSYECVYEYAVKTKNADTETYAAILQFNDLRAKFTDYTAFQLDSLTQTGNATEAQLKATE